jgi:hypothetical protein
MANLYFTKKERVVVETALINAFSGCDDFEEKSLLKSALNKVKRFKGDW